MSRKVRVRPVTWVLAIAAFLLFPAARARAQGPAPETAPPLFPGGGLVSDVRINWVWMPPWGPQMITEDGREQLRALGFNV